MRWIIRPSRSFVQWGALLRIPKTLVDVDQVRADLTITNTGFFRDQRYGVVSEDPAVLEMWEEDATTISVPRNYDVAWRRRPGLMRALEFRGSKVGLDHVIKLRNSTQHEASEALLANTDDKIISLACGAGKGLPNSSRVLTPRGWRRVDSIKVGSRLVSASGKPTTVLGVYPQGVRPCFKLTFSDGTSVVCDDQHLWEFTVDNRRREVWTTQELSETAWSTAAGKRFALDLVAPVHFEETRSLPIDPWVLGMYLGDGSWRNCTITNEERDLLDRILAKHEGALFQYEGRCGGVRLYQPFRTYLAKLGLSDRLSNDKFIPKRYLRAGVNARIQLLQGLVDSDGSVSRGNTVDYASVSRQLVDDFSDLARSLGGVVSPVNSRVTTFRYLKETREGQESFRVRVQFPRGDVVPVSSIKKEAKWVGRYQRKRKYLVSVEPSGSQETVCFRVASKRRLFVTEGYNLTHNTVVFLYSASEGERFPALIIVNTNTLMGQWKKAIKKFYGLEDSEIGRIQAGTCDWKGKKIVIAMIHSLVRKKYPQEMYDYFRLVGFDEVHRLGALTFGLAAKMFRGERWGLSATVDREDRMERAFKLHLGEVAYANLEQPLNPKIFFVDTGIKVDMSRFMSRGGRVNLGKLWTVLAEDKKRNKFILTNLLKAVRQGRTILILGERLTQLSWFYTALRALSIDASLHVGAMSEEEREEALTHQVVCATQHLAREGLDRPAFDTLFVALPFGSRGRLQQSIGRILRMHDGKKSPKVLVFVDDISISVALARKMRRALRPMGFQALEVSRDQVS